ncbi:hypothetical protein IE81DRAFT_41177 [Ceraceosorus guamensis]|uniref:Uncharacterized protein n=1 Tax=Ceraceosorus guamensis TaxID=1522189 RepID=A0A316VPI3_9BASI|nr:hypothetical protein IE81DRAFT_41177 [Ceraceosorus guamensis]PWN39240.1 hypothetical protein IE81DRAFT_41177 [Ceraceosorus guamensis]
MTSSVNRRTAVHHVMLCSPSKLLASFALIGVFVARTSQLVARTAGVPASSVAHLVEDGSHVPGTPDNLQHLHTSAPYRPATASRAQDPARSDDDWLHADLEKEFPNHLVNSWLRSPSPPRREKGAPLSPRRSVSVASSWLQVDPARHFDPHLVHSWLHSPSHARQEGHEATSSSQRSGSSSSSPGFSWLDDNLEQHYPSHLVHSWLHHPAPVASPTQTSHADADEFADSLLRTPGGSPLTSPRTITEPSWHTRDAGPPTRTDSARPPKPTKSPRKPREANNMSTFFKYKRKLESKGKDASEWNAKIIALAEKEKVRTPVSQHDYYVNIKGGGWRQVRDKRAAGRAAAAQLRAQPTPLGSLSMKQLYHQRDRARAEGKPYADVQEVINAKSKERGLSDVPNTLNGFYNRTRKKTRLPDEPRDKYQWTGMTVLYRAKEAAVKQGKDTRVIDEQIGQIAKERGVPFPRSASHFNYMIWRKRVLEKQAKEEAARHDAGQQSSERSAQTSDPATPSFYNALNASPPEGT